MSENIKILLIQFYLHWNKKINILIDTSEIPINVYDNQIMIEKYNQSDFNSSVEITKMIFSRKNILIDRNCRRTISDIESFKYLNNKNETIKYITENDGFIRNIRIAIKYYGMII